MFCWPTHSLPVSSFHPELMDLCPQATRPFPSGGKRAVTRSREEIDLLGAFYYVQIQGNTIFSSCLFRVPVSLEPMNWIITHVYSFYIMMRSVVKIVYGCLSVLSDCLYSYVCVSVCWTVNQHCNIYASVLQTDHPSCYVS